MRDVPADITRIADRVRAAAVVSQGVMKQLAVGVIDAPNRPANRPATPAVGRSARVQGDNESVDQLVARIEATGAPLGSIVEHVGVHVKSKPIASRRAYTQSAELSAICVFGLFAAAWVSRSRQSLEVEYESRFIVEEIIKLTGAPDPTGGPTLSTHGR